MLTGLRKSRLVLFIKISFIGFILLFIGSSTTKAQNTTTSETDIWKIKNFQVEITTTSEDEIEVEERIDAQFFIEKHGIFRNIPYKYSSESGSLLGLNQVDIDVISVIDSSGEDWEYDVSKQGDFVSIKIGDPDKYVVGEQTYIIKYTARRVIGFYEAHDELFWNVTGNQWPVQIENSSVKIYSPESLSSDQIDEIDLKCFTGSYGSTAEDCTITSPTENGVIEISSDYILEVGEGLTIVVGYPKGHIDEPSFIEKYAGLILVNTGICLPIFTFPAALFIWYKKGKDPKGRGTIMPQYDPPPDLSPAESGVLIDNTANNHDVTATVIDLAIRGYIQIEELPKKLLKGTQYAFHLKQSDLSKLQNHEQLLMNGIFGFEPAIGKVVNLSDLQNKFYTTVSAIQNDLYDSVVSKGYFTKKPKSLMGIMIFIGIIFIFITLIGASIFLPLGAIGTMMGLFISGAIFIAFSPFMSQRSPKGSEMQEYLQGLKMYIEIAEKDRIDVLQAPDSQYVTDRKAPKWDIKLFEQLLPYAMVFKIEKKWAEKFKDIYKEAPNWYAGGNWNTFNTVYFMNSLSSATNSMSSSFTSTPRSSGSGFSGGGFSGGGGGGGGGGSW